MIKIASCQFLLFVSVAALAGTAVAQDRIYRCGNEYTNDAAVAKERGCKVVEGGNVTVIQGTSPAAPAGNASLSGSGKVAVPKVSLSPASAPRVSPNDQRARDADARSILEAELKKALARQAEIKAEYNSGAPQRNALDLRNPQVYMERTEALKAAQARADADVAGIQREIDRLPAP